MGGLSHAIEDALQRVREVDFAALQKLAGLQPILAKRHYHDTGGRALDNIDVSLAAGVTVFDTAVGGLGGCPYAPGARGNVATETVVAHLRSLGIDTGIDPSRLDTAKEFAISLRDEHV